MTITDQQRDQLVRRYLEVDAKRRELDDECNNIKAQLRKAYDVGYQAVTGDGVKVALSPNRRFDPKAAADKLPPELLTLCVVEKVDSATAKRNLPPAMYEACMAEVGEARVTIA